MKNVLLLTISKLRYHWCLNGTATTELMLLLMMILTLVPISKRFLWPIDCA